MTKITILNKESNPKFSQRAKVCYDILSSKAKGLTLLYCFDSHENDDDSGHGTKKQQLIRLATWVISKLINIFTCPCWMPYLCSNAEKYIWENGSGFNKTSFSQWIIKLLFLLDLTYFIHVKRYQGSILIKPQVHNPSPGFEAEQH